MLSQSEKTITCTRPLYAPGRHKDNRGVPVAAEFMDISIPNAQHRIYAALGSVPDPAMKCQSNPKFFTGTWSLTKIDTKDQDGSFKYQLDEVNCIVTGNSVVAPDSHVLRFWVDGEKAAGYVRRTLSGCTTYVPYNIDIIPGKNQFHVVIGASGCDMPASQELVFTKN